MDFGALGSKILILSLLFFKYISCQQVTTDLYQKQQPNTDGYYVSEFLLKMGLASSSQIYNFSAPVCSFPGVLCDGKKEHVVKFVASGLSLSGAIPDNTIGKLGKIQSLDLSNNKITALPSDLWSLGSLKSLNLSCNLMSGSFPSNVGNFVLLERFDISGNGFSGDIPEAISSLLSLQVLKLGQNKFERSIPQGILKCQSLVVLDVSLNQLNGSLPDGFGFAFPKLKILNLAGNGISGRDSDFTGLKSLTILNISGNQFQGSVRSVFMEQLEVIDVSRNHFTGHISQVPFDASYNLSRLVYLDMSENELSGDIIHDFNQAQNLKSLNLACNRFDRQEFPEIDMLSGLEYLNLSGTSLTGNIPVGIKQLINLHTLDISMNHLTGRVPPLDARKLQVLDVSKNNLSGEVPLSLIKKLPYIEMYNFSYNHLTLCASEIPPETLQKAFLGSLNSCPIAVKPYKSNKKAPCHKGRKLALALSLSMFCLLVGVLLMALGCRRKSNPRTVKQASYGEEQNISGPFSFQTDSKPWVADVKQATSVHVVIFEKPLLNITFADLLSATSNFDPSTLLAQAKYGPVYRGFLPGGIHVAVKILVHNSILTDQEAARELEYLGRIKHSNLVPLTGYCLAGEQRIAIYDYMENGNLQNLLYDLPHGISRREGWSTDTWEEDGSIGVQNVGSEGLLTTWRFRHKIALGTARALAFLHHGCSPPIIHRDVKASNVYLDFNLEPRLSDFGLAKICGNNIDDDISSCSPGYVPPELLQPENEPPTPKSDVYCFGVVLLELITGKKPVGDDYPVDEEASLVSWVRGLVRKNQGSNAIDPKFRESGPSDQIMEALKIGYLCTADLPSKRPTMQQIVGLLKDIEPTALQQRVE